MKLKEIIKYAIGGVVLAMILIALMFGAIYQQSLREKPLTVAEMKNT